jgi:hypothetical protein
MKPRFECHLISWLFLTPRKHTPVSLIVFTKRPEMDCEFGTHSHELERCLPRVITVKVSVVLEMPHFKDDTTSSERRIIPLILQSHFAGSPTASEKSQMETAKLVTPHHEDDNLFEDGRFSRSELLEQLERIVRSKHFRNSKRYPTFLRFVVEQTLAGKTETLKERTLGVDVFARPNHYDTNDDPIVRVTAGEIRKRIAQYYQEPGHEEELRIDLPLGSYVPHFLPAAHARQIAEHDHLKIRSEILVATAPVLNREMVGPEAVALAAKQSVGLGRWKRTFLFGLLFLLITAATLAGVLLRNHLTDQGINYFWRPIIASGTPAIIVIGVHSLDERGQDDPTKIQASSIRDGQENMLAAMVRSDMIPVSDIVSYSEITDLLTRRTHVYRTKGSADTTFEDLRQGPVILIGGLDNIWTKRLVAPLRFGFFASTQLESEIRDSKDSSHVWKFDNMQLVSGDSRDYAIVASYFDSTIGQHVLVVAGIGKAGTQAAAEFVTSDQDLKSWLTEEKVPRGKNVELVLSTEILDGQPGPPHVVASSIW